MVMQAKNWWSPTTIFKRWGWAGTAPLSSLADIGEPRIGVTSDASMRPLLFEAQGLAQHELEPLRAVDPHDPVFSKIFAVHAIDKTAGADPIPLVGRYYIVNGALTFIPQHPLHEGQTYRAVLNVSDAVAGGDTSSRFTVCRDVVPTRPRAESSVSFGASATLN